MVEPNLPTDGVSPNGAAANGTSADDEYQLAPLPETFESAESPAYRKPDDGGDRESYEVGAEVDAAPFPVGAKNWREAAAGVRRDSDEIAVAPELPRRSASNRSLILLEAARRLFEVESRRFGNVDDDRRFSLKGLFGVLTVTSVVLALGSRLPRPMFAFLIGAAAFSTLFLSRWMRKGSALLVLAWWILLTIYLLVAAFAMLGY